MDGGMQAADDRSESLKRAGRIHPEPRQSERVRLSQVREPVVEQERASVSELSQHSLRTRVAVAVGIRECPRRMSEDGAEGSMGLPDLGDHLVSRTPGQARV